MSLDPTYFATLDETLDEAAARRVKQTQHLFVRVQVTPYSLERCEPEHGASPIGISFKLPLYGESARSMLFVFPPELRKYFLNKLGRAHHVAMQITLDEPANTPLNAITCEASQLGGAAEFGAREKSVVVPSPFVRDSAWTVRLAYGDGGTLHAVALVHSSEAHPELTEFFASEARQLRRCEYAELVRTTGDPRAPPASDNFASSPL